MPCRGTQLPRFTTSVRNGRHQSAYQRHDKILIPVCFQSTDAASKSAQSPRPRRGPLAAVNSLNERNVDPDSLRNTLDAHREANRASLIVKIAGSGTGRQAIEIPSLVERKRGPTIKQLKNSKQLKEKTALAPKHRIYTKARNIRGQPRLGTQNRHAGEELEPQWTLQSGLGYYEEYPWMRCLKPLLKPEQRGQLTGVEQLGKEIDGFSLYSQATPQEREAAEIAKQDICTAIKDVDPGTTIDLVGSRATGLDLPMSDIDLNVSTSTVHGDSQSHKALLQRVAERLMVDARKKGHLRNVTLKSNAKVPILVGRHGPTYLEFQVQSSENISLSLQQTVSFINEFPTLRNLFIVLKQMLTMRGLTRGSEEGLTSYPLLIMIVAALKFSEGKIDRWDTGGQLLFFLDMYADIDFTTTAISFSPLQYVLKRHPHSSILPHVRSAAQSPDNVPLEGYNPGIEDQDMDARRRFATIKPDAEFLMCLQDPADLRNDLGKAAYKIREVQSIFVVTRKRLRADLRLWEDRQAHDMKAPLLASCVGGDYRLFEHRRYELRESVRRISGRET